MIYYNNQINKSKNVFAFFLEQERISGILGRTCVEKRSSYLSFRYFRNMNNIHFPKIIKNI